MEVEVAEGREAAQAALRRREFLVVVVDETMRQCDPAAAEAICERRTGDSAYRVNFALSGASRLMREIRAALHRRPRTRADAGPPRRRRPYRGGAEIRCHQPAAAAAQLALNKFIELPPVADAPFSPILRRIDYVHRHLHRDCHPV